MKVEHLLTHFTLDSRKNGIISQKYYIKYFTVRTEAVGGESVCSSRKFQPEHFQPNLQSEITSWLKDVKETAPNVTSHKTNGSR